MRWVSFTIFLILFTIVSAGNLLNYIAVGELNIKPDLLIVFMVFLATKIDARDAIIASFIIGFVSDAASTTVGPAMVAFGIIGSAFSAMKGMLIMERMRYQFFMIFFVSVVVLSIIETLTFLKTGSCSPRLFSTIFGTALYTSVVAPLIWRMLSSVSILFGVTEPRRRRR